MAGGTGAGGEPGREWAGRPPVACCAMRFSRLFGSTLRSASGTLEPVGHELLVRGGFVRQLGQGLFSYLPLGWRVVRRIEAVLREEMDRVGGVELSLPLVQPAELWRATGRWDSIGAELVRLTDRRSRELVLAMTHEEVVASLAASEVRSWRDLPRLVYQIQLKFRDDPRPRAGLIRTREFTMKDAYSLDADQDGLEVAYREVSGAYERIFARCRLPVMSVGADAGMMGGALAHEYMYLSPVGEDTLVLCPACGYAQNRQVATFAKVAQPAPPAPVRRVATPGATTIEALASFLAVPAERTAKAVFLVATGAEVELVVAVVRGDMTLNETKLANVLGARELRPMTTEEILSIGSVPGYGSPVGISSRAKVVVDDLVAATPNLVAGANEEGWHLENVTAGRDYQADVVADIVAAEEGFPCAVCAAPLRTSRGVEVGNIFQLGTRYSEALGATYLDQGGVARPVVMGSYGIGVGRLLACIAEEHHDAAGLCWPVSVAPFQVHLCALGAGEEAAAVYAELEAAGLEVLWDDRDARPGVQFADADLIGAPLRLTVSARSLAAGGVEARRRRDGQSRVLGRDEVLAWVHTQLAELAQPS